MFSIDGGQEFSCRFFDKYVKEWKEDVQLFLNGTLNWVKVIKIIFKYITATAPCHSPPKLAPTVLDYRSSLKTHATFIIRTYFLFLPLCFRSFYPFSDVIFLKLTSILC